jgi:hypothetical protein
MLGTSKNIWDFDPRNIPNCALWLDGADVSSITLNGSTVSQWRDKSGNGYNMVQATSGNQPTFGTSPNGNRMLTFTQGSSTRLTNTSFPSFIGSGPVSYFLVEYNMTAPSGNPGPFGYSSGPNFGLVFQFNPGTYGGLSSTTVNYSGFQPFYDTTTYDVPFYSPVPRISFLSVPNTGSGMTGFVNGVSKSVGSQSAGTYSGTFTVGSASNGYISGNICEIIIFNRILTTIERQQIEGYLAQKWYMIKPPPTGFLPTSITGCQLWLDGSDLSSMTFSGSTITQWNDKSTNNRHTSSYSGTPTLTTINNVQAVSFNGSSDFTGSIPGSGTALTVCIVGTRTAGATTNGGVVCFGRSGQTDNGDVGSLSIYNGDSTIRVMLSTRTVNSQITYIGAEPYIFILIFDGTNVNTYLDGLIVGSSVSVTGTFAFTGYKIANRAGTSGTIRHTGSIGEVIVFNSALSTTNRNYVEQYLANKWRLKTLIPFSLASSASSSITSPLDIANCAIWNDASTLTGSGTVSTWTNPAGTYTISCSGTKNAAGRNGLNTVLIATNQTWTTSPTVTLSAYTLFWSGRTTNTNGGRVLQSTTNNQLYGYWSTVERALYIDGNPGILSGFSPNTDWDIFSHSRTQNGAWTYNWNGASIYTGTSSANTSMSGLAINSGAHSGEVSSSEVGEIILYSRVLTSTEITSVETYLINKWGTAAAPTTSLIHPYYSIKPRLRVFQPTDISGCILWLDSSDRATLTGSSTITAIADKSGSGAITTAYGGTPTLSNINGIPALYYDGSTYIRGSWNGTSYTGCNATIFVVASMVDAVSYNAFQVGGNNTNSVINTTMGTNVIFNYGTSIVVYNNNIYDLTNGGITGTSLGANEQVLIRTMPAFGNPFMYVNRATFVSAFISGTSAGQGNSNVITTDLLVNGDDVSNTTTGTGNSMTYGAGRPSVYSPNISNWIIGTSIQLGGYWKGTVGEVVVFSNSLTVPQIKQVEGYLANKWKITSAYPIAKTPLSVANCRLWLDSTDSTTITGSSPVTAWLDKSSNAYSFSGTGAVTSNLGSQANRSLFFNNASYLTNNSLSITNPYTVFTVAYQTSNSGSYQRILNGLSNTSYDAHLFVGALGSNVAVFIGTGPGGWNDTNSNTPATNSLSNWTLITATVSAGTVITYVNGDTINSKSGNTSLTMSGLNVGGGGGSLTTAGQAWNGHIGEVIFYSGVLSASQRQSIEGYLSNKWKIRLINTLSPSHPFRRLPPSSVTLPNFKQLTYTGNDYNVYFAKYSSDGEILWALRWTATGGIGTRDIAVDSRGNVYVTGFYVNSSLLMYDINQKLVRTLANSGGYDGLVAKYSSSGTLLWTSRHVNAVTAYPTGIAVDSSGNVYAGGTWDGANVTIYSAGEASSNTYGTTGGQTDGYIVKYNSSGIIQWSAKIVCSSYDTGGMSLKTDSSGDVYSVGINVFAAPTFYNANGTTGGSLSWGGSTEGAWLAKWNSSGTFQWALRFVTGDMNTSRGALSIDSSANLYVSSAYDSSLSLRNTGDGLAATMTNSGSYDAFLVKYSSAGSYIWNARVGGSGSSQEIGNAIDGNGNLYIMGIYTGTIIVYTSGEASSITLSNSGGFDNFIAKYTSAGALLWATRIASSGNENYKGLSVDPQGNVYAFGGYEGTVTFFNAGGTSAGTLSNVGFDSYLAKYDTNGQFLWVARITGAGSDNAEVSAADANGNIYLGGIYNSSPVTLNSA